MIRYPGIEVDEDLVEGVGVRIWATVALPDGSLRIEPIVLCIDEVRTLHAQIEDALDEYKRQVERAECNADAAEDRGDRLRQEAKEEGCGFGVDGSACYACETKGGE